MSNRALNRFLRREDHHAGNERFQWVHSLASASATRVENGIDFTKRENREVTTDTSLKKERDKKTPSVGNDVYHYHNDGIHKPGADADSDGKTNEAADKKKPSFTDKNKNGKPDAFEK